MHIDQCPDCDSENVVCSNSQFSLYYCEDCGSRFSEEDVVVDLPSARRKPRRSDEGWSDDDDY